MRGEAVVQSRAIKLTPLGWVCLVLAVILTISGPFFRPDDIEVTPVHDHHLAVWAVTVGVALILAAIGFSQSRDTGLQRWVTSLVFGVLAAQGSWFLASAAATRLEMQADFPAATTRTVDQALALGKARRWGGKTTHWSVDTAGPTPVRLPISRTDYDFMTTHVAGDGFFCAHVTVQTAGKALRVLHGAHQLPTGTVAICPAAPDPTPHGAYKLGKDISVTWYGDGASPAAQ